MVKEELGSELDLDRYEFMPHSRPVSETEPEMILFREKKPRLSPAGSWSRIYCLGDGSVQQRGSATGNFEEYEEQHTIRAK